MSLLIQHDLMKSTNNEQITPITTDNSGNSATDNKIQEALSPKKREHRAPFWADIIVILSFFFLSQFAGVFICNLVGISTTPSDPTEELSQSTLEELSTTLESRYIACAFFFAMIVCFILLAAYRKWRGFGKMITLRKPSWSSPYRILSAYILMWCFSIAVEPFADMLMDSPEQRQQGGWLLFSAILVAPLFEEILFRGYVAGTLRKAYGATTAWIVSSILFGLAHGSLSAALTASFSGLILCYCYLRYRSLTMAIILHAMNNATACFLISVGLNDVSARDVIANDQIYWAVYALCLSVAIIAFVRMRQEIKALESNKYLH